MRKALLAAVVGAFGLVLPVRAADEAKAVVEKAIKAHGGLDKLLELKGAPIQAKAKGRLHQLGGIDVTIETSAQAKKFKQVIQGEVMNTAFTQTILFNGKKVLIDVNGKEIKLDAKKLLAAVEEQLHASDITELVFLGKKGFELSPLGEVKVDDKPAVGVRVSSKGHRDVNLFFDRQKGLLIKTETRDLDFLSGQEVTTEKILSDYKKVAGLLRPTKVRILRDGKKFMELAVEETKLVDKFADEFFDKP